MIIYVHILVKVCKSSSGCLSALETYADFYNSQVISVTESFATINEWNIHITILLVPGEKMQFISQNVDVYIQGGEFKTSLQSLGRKKHI